MQLLLRNLNTFNLCKLQFTPRHSQNRHFVALRCFAAHLLRLQDAMLMNWRSRPTFLQADFHARQKIAHKNVRVNCKTHYTTGLVGKAIS